MINILTSLVLMVGLLTTVAPVLAGGGSVRSIKGTISTIDVTAKIVTIAPKVGSNLTLTVATTAMVKRNGSKVTLDKLQMGDMLEANYNKLTKIASKIEARTNIRCMDLNPATLANLQTGDLIDAKYNPVTPGLPGECQDPAA